MQEKGFTLIELLAVIVILAIIALIATPIILGIINDAKNESSMRSAELYLKGAELAIARYNLTNELGDTTCSVVSATGNLSCTTSNDNNIDIEVEMDGEKPTSGTIVFSNGKITSVTNLQTSGKTFETDSNGKLVIAGNSSSNTDTGVEETNTQTMYYTYDLSGTVLTTDAPAEPSTDVPAGKNAYIGYNISEGKVSAAYICFKRNGEQYCLKGKDTSAYSDNQDVLREAFSDVVQTSACSFGDDYYNCYDDSLSASVYLSGIVDAGGGSAYCRIDGDGNFNCY